MRMIFTNREEAGRRLAEALSDYEGEKNTLVLALPRGGVPVARQISHALHLPLDLLLVRKLGVPGHEELAMGAIAWGNIRYFNDDIVKSLNISRDEIDRVVDREQRVLVERNSRYRNDRPPPKVEDKTVIIVDDGLATGATMKAAVAAMRQAGAANIVVAVPVGAPSACADLESLADTVVCLSTPEPFYGVGRWYADFSQTSDFEVQELLEMAAADAAGSRERS